MKKKIIVAAFLCMAGGIANAASLDNQSSVNADFTVTGGCSVAGAWTGSTIPAGQHQSMAQKVGTLDIKLTGCDSKVYFEGADKSSDGLPQATSPSDVKVVIMPEFMSIGNTWSKDTDLNGFYSVSELTDGNTISANLYNRDAWKAEAGLYKMTLNIATYSL
ncbi:TPA: CD15/CS22/SEF14 family fimbrial major subunit [Escherichia coli]|nr:CD15/CS22/SEF14 family fimbrial major subunit [Escherichia coli]HCD7651301.1 CD15/CS22/SEF14 family fimbrial major subunit [Escherichia coli]